MVSSARQTITCSLLVLSTAFCTQAQTPPTKAATASISGKVTIKGKPAVGVVIAASDPRDERSLKRNRARTDQTGGYRITNLPAGTYEIYPLTAALVPSNQSDTVVVLEGEQVEDVHLELVPGGVITGRITDSEGEPIIGERVTISPVSNDFPRGFGRVAMTRLFSDENSTDDRGVYRAFGLPAGKYKVSVGRSRSSFGDSRQYYKEIFYPSVTDAEKATIIEVIEGSVANAIDIVVGRPIATFKVSGRVIDGETGRPVPNMRLGVAQTFGEGEHGSSTSSFGPHATNANGAFRLESLGPGRYTILTTSADRTEMATGSVSFQIVDRDVPDLIIKITKGVSLSGVVHVEGTEKAAALLNTVRLCASEVRTDMPFSGSRLGIVNQDGTFRIDGLRSGFSRLWLCSFNRQEVEIVRVERNGVPQAETIEVKEAEHITGIRVVLKYQKLTAAIRGQVKVEGGELPPVSRIQLSLWPLDENLQPKQTSSIPTPQLDSRGRFFIEGLPAGTYRLGVSVFKPGGTWAGEQTSQRVSVTDDMVTEVTLVIKPEPNDDE